MVNLRLNQLLSEIVFDHEFVPVDTNSFKAANTRLNIANRGENTTAEDLVFPGSFHVFDKQLTELKFLHLKWRLKKLDHFLLGIQAREVLKIIDLVNSFDHVHKALIYHGYLKCVERGPIRISTLQICED